MLALIFTGFFVLITCQPSPPLDHIEKLTRSVQKLVEQTSNLEKQLHHLQSDYRTQLVGLARQVNQQQLYAEEMTRSTGDSGIKLTRLTDRGSKPYQSTTFTGTLVAAIHDHSNYRSTLGMGELVAVLNGVEFRTRHNDYKLVMPSTTSSEYGKTEPIPFPDVPPEVLEKPTLELQVKEMREWFRAWKNSDYSVRDYRKYFKANLCYLEGMWTESDGGHIDEPFQSDRHQIEAKSFFDLQEKIRYTSATGRKNTLENFSYLPTTISNIDDFGNITYSQWNYNILCHPLKKHVPLTRFYVEDDLTSRVTLARTLEAHEKSRAARFSLYDDPKDTIIPRRNNRFTSKVQGSFLDNLMREIPGKDNYPANITENSLGSKVYPADAHIVKGRTDSPLLNVGYYHRSYMLNKDDAMGIANFQRGFSDASLYVAYNTRSKVTPVTVEDCERNVCQHLRTRVSYAIPLEVVYTTPLQRWNPYNLTYYEDDPGLVFTYGTNGKYRRYGGQETDSAYGGVSYLRHYITPASFYEDEHSDERITADTYQNTAGVLDQNGVVRRMVAGGIYISLKSIPGLGTIRTRYPIMPIHENGNTVYKELYALKDMVLYPNKHRFLYPDAKMDNGTLPQVYTLTLPPSTRAPPGPHTHTFELTEDELLSLYQGKHLTVRTSADCGHDHELIIYVDSRLIIYINFCDGNKWECWDGHRGRIERYWDTDPQEFLDNHS